MELIENELLRIWTFKLHSADTEFYFFEEI